MEAPPPLLTAGQMSDYKRARHLLERLPKAKELLADRGYDADWFRNGLKEKGISPGIPPRKKRRDPAHYDELLYKQRQGAGIRGAARRRWFDHILCSPLVPPPNSQPLASSSASCPVLSSTGALTPRCGCRAKQGQ
jgi:transposase